MTIETNRTGSSDIETAAVEDIFQYVTFMMADEMYGISVHNIQSINEMVQITHIPDSCSFIEGVINLRGTVVPVVSMRKKYNLPVKQYDQFTVILIVEINERLAGLIVDSVSDVVSLTVSDIQRDVRFSAMVDKDSIEGIANLNDQLIILLDVNHFFDDNTEIDMI